MCVYILAQPGGWVSFKRDRVTRQGTCRQEHSAVHRSRRFTAVARYGGKLLLSVHYRAKQDFRFPRDLVALSNDKKA